MVELAPDNLAALLGYAWCVEQSGQKRKAVEAYRKVIKAAWLKEKDLKSADIFGWQSISAEAAGYLIPLLDKDTLPSGWFSQQVGGISRARALSR